MGAPVCAEMDVTQRSSDYTRKAIGISVSIFFETGAMGCRPALG